MTLTLNAIFGLDNNVHSLSDTLKDLLTLPLFFILYGSIPIAIFLAAIIILDTICFFQKADYVLHLLLIEWLLIVFKPNLWVFEYQYWMWMGLSLSLLVTKWIRCKYIKKINPSILNYSRILCRTSALKKLYHRIFHSPYCNSPHLLYLKLREETVAGRT